MTGLLSKPLPLISWSLVLCLGIPAMAEGFKVYISTDMEGCSGVTCSEQVAGEEGRLLMTGDMNACIEGCFAAGATEVVVRDHHSSGTNVDPEAIDKRAKLIQGKTPENRFKIIEGSDAMILLGYHAMALTPNGTLAHSFSSRSIQGMCVARRFKTRSCAALQNRQGLGMKVNLRNHYNLCEGCSDAHFVSGVFSDPVGAPAGFESPDPVGALAGFEQHQLAC